MGLGPLVATPYNTPRAAAISAPVDQACIPSGSCLAQYIVEARVDASVYWSNQRVSTDVAIEKTNTSYAILLDKWSRTGCTLGYDQVRISDRGMNRKLPSSQTQDAEVRDEIGPISELGLSILRYFAQPWMLPRIDERTQQCHEGNPATQKICCLIQPL